MIVDPELHWLNPENLAWHRGLFVTRQPHGWSIAARMISGSIASVSLAQFADTASGVFMATLRGHVTALMEHVAEAISFAPVDQIPWEIHRIRHRDVRLAATKAFLLESRLTVNVLADRRVNWPPGERLPGVNANTLLPRTVILTFPTGEHRNYKIES